MKKKVQTRVRKHEVEGWWIDVFRGGQWCPDTWTAGTKKDALQVEKDVRNWEIKEAKRRAA